MLYQLNYRRKNGRADRIRTCDPLLPKQMRYQAALQPDLVPGTALAGLTLESIAQYRGECRRGQIVRLGRPDRGPLSLRATP